MEVTLIPAEESDKEYFANLSEFVYRELVERQIGPWNSTRERDKFDKKWGEQGYQKILLSDELIGGYWVQEFDSYFQLREFQIHPDFQNLGIGTRLLSNLIEQCLSDGKELRLRVLKLNPVLSLYKRLGFKVVGENEYQYWMVYAS